MGCVKLDLSWLKTLTNKVINMNECTLCMCIYFGMLSSQWIHEDKMSPCTVSTTGDNLCKEG